MKKILIQSLITLTLIGGLNSSVLASDNNVIASNQTISSRIIEQIKSIFSSEKKLTTTEKTTSEKVKNDIQSDTSPTTTTMYSNLSTSSSSTSSNADIKPLAPFNSKNGESGSLLTETVTATTSEPTTSTSSKCLAEDKVLLKIEKVEQQIRNEIRDKNKLVANLNQIASSTLKSETKELIDEKIVKLETLVADVITRQKDLSATLASSTEYICDKPLNKQSAANENKIKSNEININKKLSEINTYIKVDIKNVLEEME